MNGLDIVKILRKLGLNSKNHNKQPIEKMLRDSRWVELFAEQGYHVGEYIILNDSPTTFLVCLDDGNIGTGCNEMIQSGFEDLCNTILDDEEFYVNNNLYNIGKTIYEENIDSDVAIQIMTPIEFKQLISIIKKNKNSDINETINKKIIKITESDLKKIIKESIQTILKQYSK